MSNRTPPLAEASLRVEHLRASSLFYQAVLGLHPVFEGEDRVGLGGVAGATLMLVATAPGDVPTSPYASATGGGRSRSLRFAINADHLIDMERHLSLHGVAIESRSLQRCGGMSLFFRDPDGHAVEITSAEG